MGMRKFILILKRKILVIKFTRATGIEKKLVNKIVNQFYAS